MEAVKEMEISITARRSARRPAPRSFFKLTSAKWRKRSGPATTLSHDTTLTLEWEPARDLNLVDVKVDVVFDCLANFVHREQKQLQDNGRLYSSMLNGLQHPY